MLHAMIVLIVEYSSHCRVCIRVVGIFRAIRTHPIGAQLDVQPSRNVLNHPML